MTAQSTSEPSPTPIVAWALAGYGAGGKVFHAPLIRAATGMRLTAIVASQRHLNDQSLRDAALVPNLTALPELGIEGVTITTPAGTHTRLAHEALDLGLHVVVDKPFALNAHDARNLAEHATAVDRRLSVYQNRRWDGDFLTIKSIVESGELGPAFRFYSRIQRFRPQLPTWNTQSDAESGGGTLVDLGPHLIDQAVQLFGRVITVSAELLRVGGGAGAENDVLVNLVHESGTRTVVEASISAASHGVRFQLNALNGGLTLDGFDAQEADLFAGRTPDVLADDWGREPTGRRVDVVTDLGIESRALQAGAWTVFYPQMAAAVRGTASVPVDPDDAVHTCEVFDAARESHREGRIVTLPTR
jgi:predicted dehydrogenase